jgi:sulfide:quinone oxidoreductase
VGALPAAMAQRDIETRLGHRVPAFGPDRVATEGGEFAADLLLFMPGLTGNSWSDASPLPRSEAGPIRADARGAGARAGLRGGGFG